MERKSKEDVVIMTEKLAPFIQTECREREEVYEYRKRLICFDQISDSNKPPEHQSGETAILNHLTKAGSADGIMLFDVLSDMCFNSMMSIETLKSALDIAFSNLEQRVTVFLVSPHCDLELKDHEKVKKTSYRTHTLMNSIISIIFIASAILNYILFSPTFVDHVDSILKYMAKYSFCFSNMILFNYLLFQFFPSKTMVICSFKSVKSLVEHFKEAGATPSTLLILNHAFKDTTLIEDTKALNEIMLPDTTTIINQVCA